MLVKIDIELRGGGLMVVETIDASLIEKLFTLNAERIDTIEVNFIDEYYDNIGKNDVDFLSTNKK